MQFKLFTAAVAAMTAGVAIAGPVPAPVEARDTNQAQFEQQVNDFNSAHAANSPNEAQLALIKNQVQSAHSANWYGSPYASWNRYSIYDDDLYTKYYPWYLLYAQLYNQNCPYYGYGYSYTCQYYYY